MAHHETRPDTLRPTYAQAAGAPLVVLGLLLAGAPVLFDYRAELAVGVDVLAGLLIAGIGLYRLLNPLRRAGLGWLSLLLGLWLVLMPIVLQFAGTDPAFWVNLATGILVVVLSAMSIGETLEIR